MRMRYLLLSFLLAASPVYAQLKISQLPGGSTLSGTELFPAVQSSQTVTITPAQIQAYIAAHANTFSQLQTVTVPSGNALFLNGAAGAYTQAIQAPVATGQSYGLDISAGTTSSDTALAVESANQTKLFEALYGDGSFAIGSNGSGSTISANAAGDISINSPSSGNTLSISGSAATGTAVLALFPQASNNAVFIDAPATASQSFGLFVRAGTNSSDYALAMANAANTENLLEVRGSGEIDAPNLQSGGGVTGYVCWNSSGGALTYDSSAACPSSSERFKTGIRSLDWALADVEKLRSVSYKLKPQYDPQSHGQREMLGFLAEEVAKVDPRLVEFDKSGKPLTVIYDRFTVLLVKAMQEEHRHVIELALSQALTLIWLAALTVCFVRNRQS